MRYEIEHDCSAESLAAKINWKLNNGWKPLGGVGVLLAEDIVTKHPLSTFYQAIILEEPEIAEVVRLPAVTVTTPVTKPVCVTTGPVQNQGLPRCNN